jgi:site-specific recombinase XerD
MPDSELALVSQESFAAPTLIASAAPETRKKFFEFFTVPIRNAHTRAAYYRAIQQFLAWCERAGYRHLEDIEPITVAAYIETLQRQAAPPTVKQHMAIGKTGKLSRRPLVRTDAADMLKRRLKKGGLPAHYSPHSFRATGITNFLENDGTLEAAQRIAGHADSRTTKLYDRRGQRVLLEDMERIRY